MKIFKYVMDGRGISSSIEMHAGSKIISVQNQNGHPTMWAEVDPTAPLEKRHFEIIPTGGEVPEKGQHMGTIQILPFVWHIYEVRK